jgi:hypothetical protein
MQRDACADADGITAEPAPVKEVNSMQNSQQRDLHKAQPKQAESGKQQKSDEIRCELSEHVSPRVKHCT